MGNNAQFRLLIQGIKTTSKPNDVIANLSHFFKIDISKLQSLKTGIPLKISQTMEKKKADSVRKKLTKLGCIVKIFEVNKQLDLSSENFTPRKSEKKMIIAPKESNLTGEIKIFYPERGYGFIESTNDQSIFFHISDVMDQDKGPVVPGDMVEFSEEPSQKKGEGFFDGKNIKRIGDDRTWEVGVIVKVVYDNGYGFIRQGANQDSVFFHFSTFNNTEGILPSPGHYVTFTNEEETDDGLKAGYVSLIEKYYGEVVAWNGGQGEILPINSKNTISVFWKDIILS